MKPRTKIQKEVAALSKRLPKISEVQKKYALLHSFEHVGRRSAKGIITCTECGHQWQGNGKLADTLCGCTCPHCGMELKVHTTRKRVFKEIEYFSMITTCTTHEFQYHDSDFSERYVYLPANHLIDVPLQNCQ